ncbi:MAG: hypothetical protein ACE37F_00870 [Nannocystaceae bacterium]|nr:hypothetical protein [bacterium]
MKTRSILPAFMRAQARGLSRSVACPRLASLPPTPPIDRDETVGVSLLELARLVEEAAR